MCGFFNGLAWVLNMGERVVRLGDGLSSRICGVIDHPGKIIRHIYRMI